MISPAGAVERCFAVVDVYSAQLDRSASKWLRSAHQQLHLTAARQVVVHRCNRDTQSSLLAAN
jgi:hypothetical protein